MSRESAIVARTREVAEAVDLLREEIEARLPIPVPEPRGYVTDLRPLSAAALGLRFCHDRETGRSLAQLMKRVPDEYVTDERVRCVCGGEMDRTGLWTDCPGGCGRTFIADAGAVYAARIPAE
jgi:hypothetical protein